ncbi:MAG: YybH family protein [Pseudomonadales bacterium]
MATALAKVEDEAVHKLILEALDVIGSDDFDRYFDLFTEDAVWMMPSTFNDVRVEEARSFYSFTRKFKFDQKASIDEVVIAGDWALVRLSFDGFLRPKAKGDSLPLQSVSRHIWVLKRQDDGVWKIARDIWNTPKITG